MYSLPCQIRPTGHAIRQVMKGMPFQVSPVKHVMLDKLNKVQLAANYTKHSRLKYVTRCDLHNSSDMTQLAKYSMPKIGDTRAINLHMFSSKFLRLCVNVILLE